MLKLKRVEIQGFKSFVDRQEMRFHGSGIAAIVGPNGCGKSNLSDAISWVLGEQSARSLRGSRMEDVIFAGTRDRKPLGMASVTMTLVDPAVHSDSPTNGNGTGHSSNHVEARIGEITITRRLYRSGESEYLINGRTARLRDIQDIFMGSGLGPESYAIIEQGRIGQILSTRPQDRRAVLEEAAGITRFKTRKRLAEAKLESARGNLTRVFDILEEVSRQVNSLRRQATKARRFTELRSEMIGQLRVALVGRFRMLEREAAKTAIDLSTATSDFTRLGVEVAGREQAASELLEQSYSIEARLTEARRQMSECRVEAERIRGKLESQAREVGSIEQRLTRGESETQDLAKRFGQQQLELEEYTNRVATLKAQAEQSQLALLAKTEERDRAQASLNEREKSIEASRQQVLRLLGEASTLRNQLGQTDQFLVGLNRDIERIERDETGAAADRERLEAAKSDIAERSAVRQKELVATIDNRKQVEEELATRRSRASEARRKLEELRGEASRLKARRDSLNDIILHRSYTTQSIKKLFTAVEKGNADLKPIGVLADFIEVEPAWERATEEFLHEELEYVLVSDWEEAEKGIAFMRGDSDGRATFLVRPDSADSPKPADPGPRPEVGVSAKLSDVIRMTGGFTAGPTDLIPRLSRCNLVEDRGVARKLALEHPGNHFLLPDGVCYHGHAVSGGKKTGSGPLGLKRELGELNLQYNAKQKEFDRTKSLLDDLELEIANFNEDLEGLRGLQNRQEKDALALGHELRKLGEELSRAGSRLQVARNELGRLTADRTKTNEKREGLRTEVASRETARAQQEQALTDARAALEELQRQGSRVSEEHSALRVEQAGIEERRRSDAAALQRIETQIREMANRRQNLARETERLGLEKARLSADNLDLSSRAAMLEKEIASSLTLVAELAGNETKCRSALAEADEALKFTRHQLQSASDRRAAFELELVKKQAELKYLDETCRKELSLPLAEVAADDTLLVLDEAGLQEAESRYQDLRSKIDALGPVNITAEEEFSEAQERYDFLNSQRTDLLDSIRDIDKAIGEIDAESRKRFVQAFEAININFREMFQTLFSGGLAEMRLTDSENAAESGIDIIAQPPGKKLQSVLLLSGGERALTAMALLMAIFRYQPSPFCVLDEVDAPLDEANIERLTRLIRDMSVSTQFIVITHAKRTMESAQALYGVTMQEPGVSKLVSVKFNPVPPPVPPLAQQELAAVN
ncbi:MAG: chromosome segregation protein SMC [Bryobacteraceae bacterium]|nr:chromosome segregation protein SMC [Bryobacteraceae bacterium]